MLVQKSRDIPASHHLEVVPPGEYSVPPRMEGRISVTLAPCSAQGTRTAPHSRGRQSIVLFLVLGEGDNTPAPSQKVI